MIDGDIRVTVTAVQGEKVRIGITAPPFIRVDRKEVHVRRSGFVLGQQLQPASVVG